MSQYTLERANRTRLLIENCYAQALAQCHEREKRLQKLEEKMEMEGWSIELYKFLYCRNKVLLHIYLFISLLIDLNARLFI